jgi:hypothetical protein
MRRLSAYCHALLLHRGRPPVCRGAVYDCRLHADSIRLQGLRLCAGHQASVGLVLNAALTLRGCVRAPVFAGSCLWDCACVLSGSGAADPRLG